MITVFPCQRIQINNNLLFMVQVLFYIINAYMAFNILLCTSSVQCWLDMLMIQKITSQLTISICNQIRTVCSQIVLSVTVLGNHFYIMCSNYSFHIKLVITTIN